MSTAEIVAQRYGLRRLVASRDGADLWSATDTRLRREVLVSRSAAGDELERVTRWLVAGSAAAATPVLDAGRVASGAYTVHPVVRPVVATSEKSPGPALARTAAALLRDRAAVAEQVGVVVDLDPDWLVVDASTEGWTWLPTTGRHQRRCSLQRFAAALDDHVDAPDRRWRRQFSHALRELTRRHVPPSELVAAFDRLGRTDPSADLVGWPVAATVTKEEAPCAWAPAWS